MKKLLVLAFALFGFAASANHIVGGEIEFIYLRDGLYRIQVIQYFDDANPFNPGPEASATVSIFSNRNDQLVSTHELLLQTREIVPYTNPECAIGELQTSRVVWSADVALNPIDYSNFEGYYIVWERCCRNATVVNIVNPLGTGMKYVLEIPPLWRNGRIFKNSSPILFQPLSDYACINQLYYIEFTGTDPDGDSLVYSLATPLNSSAAVALPIPQPKPHAEVVFRDPFSISNTIPGDPALRISNRGLLTVTPTQEGLYVFSVLVEEYRRGTKIGEVQRDFQMLVISEGCDPPDPPQVAATIPGNPDFQSEIDTLFYTVGEEKCFDFIVTNLTQGETISLRAEGVNFDGELEDVFSIEQQFIGTRRDTLELEVCISDCPPVRGRPFIVDLIAGDDACPLPQQDTLRLTIQVEPPANQFPVISPDDRTLELREDDSAMIEVTGTDADGELMTMELFVRGLEDPAASGFELEVTDSREGSITGAFTWDTNCLIRDFTTQQDFEVGIIVDDLDTCNVPNPDTLWVDSKVLLPPNSRPLVAANGQFLNTNQITVRPEGLLQFDVTVTDTDGDTVNLAMVTDNFNPTEVGASFEDTDGIGFAESIFSWNLDCPFETTAQSEFKFFFVADDEDKCQVVNFDTLELTVNIDFTNEAPVIDRFSDFQLFTDEPFTLDIGGTDANGEDVLTIDYFQGFRRPESPSLSFLRSTGRGSVTSTLSWTPECELLDGRDNAFFDLWFIVFDDACPSNLFDSTRLTFEIINPMGAEEFIPPNVFTPNGDGINDIFLLTGLEPLSANLPPDNCDDKFLYISIINRAGKEVFRSENREFQWDGGDAPSGTYYYIAQYINSSFKGFVQLLR